MNIQKIILAVLVLRSMKETGGFFIASADAHAQQNDKVSKITKIIEKNRFITKVCLNIFFVRSGVFLIVRRTNWGILKIMETFSFKPALRMLRQSLWMLMVAAVCVSRPAQAETFLKADEIRAVLSDNTVMWNLGKVTQRQYFNSRGYTVFEDENFNIDKGLWTVTSDGLFCTNWKQTGWTCYRLMLDGASLAWVGPVSPFGSKDSEQKVVSRLLRGNQTTFSAPQGSRGDELVATVARDLDPKAQ